MGNAILLPIATALKNQSDVAKKFGWVDKNKENKLDEMANSLLDASDYITNRSSFYSKVNANINDELTRNVGNVTNVIGNMIPSVASNMIAPGSGLIVTGLSSGEILLKKLLIMIEQI